MSHMPYTASQYSKIIMHINMFLFSFSFVAVIIYVIVYSIYCLIKIEISSIFRTSQLFKYYKMHN